MAQVGRRLCCCDGPLPPGRGPTQVGARARKKTKKQKYKIYKKKIKIDLKTKKKTKTQKAFTGQISCRRRSQYCSKKILLWESFNKSNQVFYLLYALLCYFAILCSWPFVFLFFWASTKDRLVHSIFSFCLSSGWGCRNHTWNLKFIAKSGA